MSRSVFIGWLLTLSVASALGVVGEPGESSVLRLPKVFHITGIPKTARNKRVDLTFTNSSLVVERGKKTLAAVDYRSVRRVQVLSGKRHYPGATYAAAVATMGFGGQFLILKKRKVDMLVFEYTNPRGGAVGMVFQVPRPDGGRCKEWLTRFGVAVE